MEARYNYVSPGIQINEIDNSGRPKTGPEVGPVVIGRASLSIMIYMFKESSILPNLANLLASK